MARLQEERARGKGKPSPRRTLALVAEEYRLAAQHSLASQPQRRVKTRPWTETSPLKMSKSALKSDYLTNVQIRGIL